MKKNRIVATLLVGVLAASLLTGCGSSLKTASNGNKYNTKYSESKLYTITGEKVDFDSAYFYDCATAGFVFSLPDSWSTVSNQAGFDFVDYSPEGLFAYYMSAANVELVENLPEDADEETINEVYSQVYADEPLLFTIYRVNPNDSNTVDDQMFFEEGFTTIEELATIGDDTFYMAYLTEVPEGEYTDKEREDLQMMIDSLPELRDRIALFPPVDQSDLFDVNMTSFTTTDIYGNEVTQDIFADYDVTMVNIWTTWCQFCVEEMPTLEKLYEDSEANVNIISICMDADEALDEALEEAEMTGITFPVLCGNEQLHGILDDCVPGYPTTFFVDSQGNVIGSLQVGAPASDEDEVYASYAELIEKALSEVK